MELIEEKEKYIEEKIKEFKKNEKYSEYREWQILSFVISELYDLKKELRKIDERRTSL